MAFRIFHLIVITLVLTVWNIPVLRGAVPAENTYQRVAFKTLRTYNPGQKPPKEVTDLHGKKVEILGFMSALTQLDDIDEFLLASSPPMNCFCHPPLRVNEIILVHMNKGRTTEYKPGVVKIRGVLKVNAKVQDEFADVMYTLECEEVL